MINENMLLHYALERQFNNEALNAIGATTSTTLRTVDTISGDTAFVRKFGLNLSITDCTDIDNPTANMTLKVFALDGTLLGSRINGGAFVAGSGPVTAQGIYIEASSSGGAGTLAATESVTLTGRGALTVNFPAETIAAGDSLDFYVAHGGSTYYESTLVYGGARHAPGGFNDEDLPYFDIATAYAALQSADDGVIVLDSAIYDEELNTDSSSSLDMAATLILAAGGQTPTITRGIGARITRSTTQEYNNTTAIYFNTNGDNVNDGTWQNPVLTIAQAIILASTTKNIVFGGINAVNNSIFAEDNFIIENIKFESDYQYVFFIKGIGNSTTIFLKNNAEIHGIDINGENVNSTNIEFITNALGKTSYIKNCNVYNAIDRNIYHNALFGGTLRMNNIETYNSIRGYENSNSHANQHVTVVDSIIRNHTDGFYHTQEPDPGLLNITVKNVKIYNNSDKGLFLFYDPGSTGSRSITNCTFFENAYGVFLQNFGGSLTVNYNIYNGNTNHGIFASLAKTITYNNFYNNTIDYNANITSNNETLTDTLFCDEANNKLEIQPISPAYRVNNLNNAGSFSKIIEINESNITINGFIIDGQNRYSTGLFIADTANHTDLILKWCTVKRFIGAGCDLYDNNTALKAQILNCNFNNNGYAMGLHKGGNIIRECLIYKNSQQGIYCKGVGDTINHNVIFQNNQGLYFDTGANPSIIKNNIISQNAISIFSEVSIGSGNIINNNIVDGVTDIVNISDPSNIIANSLFINTITAGLENFNIKTKETNILDDDGNIIGQYTLDSPCKDAGDDGFDMGAFKVDREQTREWYSRFQLYSNPFELNPDKILKGAIDFENAEGSPFKLGKSHKWVFPFTWADDDDQSEEQVDIMRFISTLAETDENGLTGDLVNILIHLLPEQFLLTGSAGTVNAVNKSLSDGSLNLTPNKFKGFHIGIKFFTSTALVIDAALKTATKAGAGWDADQFKGFFVYHNFYYYFILSNTSEVLTLSDPFDTLTDETIADFSIEKYFKILAHSKNQFILEDGDGELIDDSFGYYIDFIICRVLNENYQPLQEGFFYQRQQSKTAYEMIFGEK